MGTIGNYTSGSTGFGGSGGGGKVGYGGGGNTGGGYASSYTPTHGSTASFFEELENEHRAYLQKERDDLKIQKLQKLFVEYFSKNDNIPKDILLEKISELLWSYNSKYLLSIVFDIIKDSQEGILLFSRFAILPNLKTIRNLCKKYAWNDKSFCCNVKPKKFVFQYDKHLMQIEQTSEVKDILRQISETREVYQRALKGIKIQKTIGTIIMLFFMASIIALDIKAGMSDEIFEHLNVSTAFLFLEIFIVYFLLEGFGGNIKIYLLIFFILFGFGLFLDREILSTIIQTF